MVSVLTGVALAIDPLVTVVALESEAIAAILFLRLSRCLGRSGLVFDLVACESRLIYRCRYPASTETYHTAIVFSTKIESCPAGASVTVSWKREKLGKADFSRYRIISAATRLYSLLASRHTASSANQEVGRQVEKPRSSTPSFSSHCIA
jgi:hypothetical protein